MPTDRTNGTNGTNKHIFIDWSPRPKKGALRGLGNSDRFLTGRAANAVMTLREFIAESMLLISAQPTPTEILVERLKPLRFAAAGPTELLRGVRAVASRL